ncbi:MAG: type II toxin-antitoxin system RelE/ParE family toxin [Candidatus Methanoperedens sp.]|nr:type II toxin-antitoxin system RelE/ParE family toxin [Candidatus Methanoperedens sp.]MCZ7385524.1 type II toxin-antitoxin system RelE/ParE family toxin [Candidatus Methanoperedens sp.]
MTSFTVLIHKKLTKDIKNLPKNHLEKFATLIETLKTNPFPWKDFDLKKIEGSEHTYRVRFGKFRVTYYVEKELKTIHVLKFETREKIYK